MTNTVYKLVLLTIASALLSANVSAKTYRILGEPELGSKFRPVEAKSPIPFNRSYDKLTEKQKALFRANYDQLSVTEQPPFPTKGLQAIYNPIIEGHVRIARGGTLFLVAMINPDGKVENVSVYESPSQRVSDLATTVLFNTEFDAASCNGKPCKMEFPFEFELRNRSKVINK